MSEDYRSALLDQILELSRAVAKGVMRRGTLTFPETRAWHGDARVLLSVLDMWDRLTAGEAKEVDGDE